MVMNFGKTKEIVFFGPNSYYFINTPPTDDIQKDTAK
jgi:hypothetical protein